MSNDQESPSEQDGRSFITSRSFILAAVVVAVIVVLGAVVGIRAAINEPETTPPPPASAPPGQPSTQGSATAEPSTNSGSAESVCGLNDTEEDGRLSSAPTSDWEYEGTVAYPKSSKFGPGASASSGGYRYCFARTPEGALFAAANGLAQATNPDLVEPWAEYFVSKGDGRDQILAELDQPRSDTSGVRVEVMGFKMLSYTGKTARVDIAIQSSVESETITGSYVYELVWEDGDWKLNSAANTPFSFATIPSTSGYVPWGA